MAKTFKEYLKEISDQQMKDMSKGNAYGGSGKGGDKQNNRPRPKPLTQEEKDALRAKRSAEYEADLKKKRAENAARLKSYGESTNEEVEVTDKMRGEIDYWIEKFSKYIGGNGDTLPEGYIQWALNSGIATDFVEQNEAEAMRGKYGEDEFENDPMSEKFQNEMPITKACLEMIEEITGDDDIDTNARIIDTVMNDDGNEPNTIKVRPGDADESTELDRIKELAGASLENNVLTTVENESGERHVVEVPIDHFKVNEGDDRIIFKGKEIDPDTIEYDMQDFSDMIAPIEYAKYTDGTEVDDEDLEALDELPAMQDWISTDYMDRRADQADMYRDAQKHGDFESTELDRIKELAGASIDETYDDDDAFYEAYGELWYNEDEIIDEAEYQGRKVKLGKPMQGDVKKFKVYVKDPKTGNVKKVNFGHGGSSVKGKAMSIKKNNPKRRKSFRARHNCDNPGPRTKARYWSCRKW